MAANITPRGAVGLVPAKPSTLRFVNPDRITGHYFGGDLIIRSEADLFRIYRGIQYQDMVNKGYTDIMYSIGLNPFRPMPVELRGLGVRGAANGTTTGNKVSPSVLVPVGPNLSGVSHIPGWQDNLIAGARLADDIIEFTFGRQMPWIGHNVWKPTACPGRWFQGLITSQFDDRPLPAPLPIEPFVAATDLAQRPIVGFNHLERDPNPDGGYVRLVQDFLNRTAPEGCSVDGIWGWISHDRLTKFQGYFQAQGFPCRVNGMTDLDTWATIHYVATVAGIAGI